MASLIQPSGFGNAGEVCRARAKASALTIALAVMPRLDRGIQYSRCFGEYWIVRSSRTMTRGGVLPESKRRTRGPPFSKNRSIAHWEARAERGPTRAWKLLLLGFLRLLRLFRLLRFLSHGKSSQGLMDGNATRGMLSGGPASQHPQLQFQQIRRLLPRAVTPVSSCYPQMLWVFECFSQSFPHLADIASRIEFADDAG